MMRTSNKGPFQTMIKIIFQIALMTLNFKSKSSTLITIKNLWWKILPKFTKLKSQKLPLKYQNIITITKIMANYLATNYKNNSIVNQFHSLLIIFKEVKPILINNKTSNKANSKINNNSNFYYHLEVTANTFRIMMLGLHK